MKDKNGFRKYERVTENYVVPKQRVEHFNEFSLPLEKKEVKNQSNRCMDCGIPFCHSGCPIHNKIPDFNAAIADNNWAHAYSILSETNNFPEFTGRLCPAPCETSCVLGINHDPVSIKTIENHIIEYAFDNHLVKAEVAPPTNKKIAIVGSGPAGLAAADQLAKAGHSVSVYERNDKIGGLLRYGIPDFKLEKKIIDRRMKVMRQAGVTFLTSTHIGVDITMEDILDKHDAILLACGSTIPRDISAGNKKPKGVHMAMDFLEQKNRMVAGELIDEQKKIDVKGKHVIVIGGGDTGADCVGTCNRLKASSITQIELLEKPPEQRAKHTPWPLWPDQLRTSTSHMEGCDRRWALNTKEFISDERSNLTGIKVVELQWTRNEKGDQTFIEHTETERIIACDLVFLAIGFTHPDKRGPISELKLELDQRGNVLARNYRTSHQRIYVAGDMRRGQSLIVWAIAEGREAAKVIHEDITESKPMRSSQTSFYNV